MASNGNGNLDPKWHGAGSPRRIGVRNKLSNKFLEDFYESWLEHGAATIKQVRWRDPVAYVNIALKILPKEMQLEVTRSVLSPELREAMIESLRQHLAKLEQQDQAQKTLLIEAKVEDGAAVN